MQPGRSFTTIQDHGAWNFRGLKQPVAYDFAWLELSCKEIYRATKNYKRPVVSKRPINPQCIAEEIQQ